MKIKKYISLSLVMILVTGILPGCGRKNNLSTKSDQVNIDEPFQEQQGQNQNSEVIQSEEEVIRNKYEYNDQKVSKMTQEWSDEHEGDDIFEIDFDYNDNGEIEKLKINKKFYANEYSDVESHEINEVMEIKYETFYIDYKKWNDYAANYYLQRMIFWENIYEAASFQMINDGILQKCIVGNVTSFLYSDGLIYLNLIPIDSFPEIREMLMQN